MNISKIIGRGCTLVKSWRISNMVIEEQFDGQDAYKCEACGFHYADKETAAECEDFCETHNSCSTELTKQSLERGGAA